MKEQKIIEDEINKLQKIEEGQKTPTPQDEQRTKDVISDIAVENLRKDIDNKNFPKWELCVQIMEIEDAFDVKVEEVENIKTVSDAVNFIEKDLVEIA